MECASIKSSHIETISSIDNSAALVGEEKTLELMAKAGFDAWDFSMFEMCKYDW